MPHLHAPTLILASTSPYRRELLSRLRLPFRVQAPHVEEAAQPGETAPALAERLALHKAQAVAQTHLGADVCVIGSDQVLDVDGQCWGKPQHLERAVQQLQALSGRDAVFQTAVAVVRPVTGFAQVLRAEVRVRFRPLDEDRIRTYLRLEPALDCAGSAKCEGLGISLLAAIDSDDPTALVGLPLIRTTTLLEGADPDLWARWARTPTEAKS